VKTRQLENAHVALWLLKDFAWCSSTKWLGVFMIAPTIGLAVLIARASWRSFEDLAHNAAVCCWVAANIVWMLGEFFFDDSTRGIARNFFYAGLLVMAVYYAHELVTTLRRLHRRHLMRAPARSQDRPIPQKPSHG